MSYLRYKRILEKELESTQHYTSDRYLSNFGVIKVNEMFDLLVKAKEILEKEKETEATKDFVESFNRVFS